MRKLILGAALLCGSATACGDDEGTTGGTSGSAGQTSDASGGSGGAGGTGASGGNGGSAGSAGTGGVAGADASNGGTAGTAPDAGDGSVGDAADAATTCKPPGSDYQIDVCSGLPSPKTVTVNIVPPYFGKVKADCRVAALVENHPAIFNFGNALTDWTLSLWGCNAVGANTFGLIDMVSKLSAADAAVLIDYYVDLTVLTLALPPSKEAELRFSLSCLAESAITNPSTVEHELSTCAAEGGVDGGEAGADASQSDGSASDASTQDASTTTDGGTE